MDKVAATCEAQNLAFARAMLAECHHPTDPSIESALGVKLTSRKFEPASFSETMKRVKRAVPAAQHPAHEVHRTVSRILKSVADYHNVTVPEMKGRRRTWSILFARQEAFYVLARGLGLSTPRIGFFFGRDHTTVLHGIRQHAKRNGLPE